MELNGLKQQWVDGAGHLWPGVLLIFIPVFFVQIVLFLSSVAFIVRPASKRFIQTLLKNLFATTLAVLAIDLVSAAFTVGGFRTFNDGKILFIVVITVPLLLTVLSFLLVCRFRGGRFSFWNSLIGMLLGGLFSGGCLVVLFWSLFLLNPKM